MRPWRLSGGVAVGLAFLLLASGLEAQGPDRRDGKDGGAPGRKPVFMDDEAVPLPVERVAQAGPRGDSVVVPRSGEPFFLGFVAGKHHPPEGEQVDPELLRNLASRELRGRPVAHTYAFVMFKKRMTRERVSELESLGVRILGFHPHYTLKVALPPAALDAVAALPFVRWVGVAKPWQKVHPELLREIAARRHAERVGVYIDVFDSDLGPASTFRLAGEVQERNPDGAVVPGRPEARARIWMSRGWQEAALEALGVEVHEYVDRIRAFRAYLTPQQLGTVVALDFVQFVEPDPPASTHHDESTPMVLSDDTRQDYGGATNSVAVGGQIDSGVDMSHNGLDGYWVGWNHTNQGTSFTDECEHGSHVCGTIKGDGSPNTSLKGNAPGLGTWITGRFFTVKLFGETSSCPGPTCCPNCCSAGTSLSTLFGHLRSSYTDGSGNVTARPHVINNSWGAFTTGQAAWTGTEANPRTLDAEVWDYRQLYVFSAGNDGSTGGTIGSPGVAKNALTVGSVVDYNDAAVGDPGNLWTSSSRGPCGDNRWKPNLAAPGRQIMSVDANSTNGYVNKSGTSMAAPHVTGIAAQLVDHYSWLRYAPHRVAALLMGTALTKNNVVLTSPSTSSTHHLNTYGAGRIEAYKAHWNTSQLDYTNWGFTGDAVGYNYADFTINAGATRLVVCMTYHEDAASSGASRALVNDFDLWIDAPPIDPNNGNTGEWFTQQSAANNTEIRILDNPETGLWRWKCWPESVTGTARVSVHVQVLYGDTTPAGTISVTAADTTIRPNQTVDVTATVTNPDTIASAVFLDATLPVGTTLTASTTTLKDGAVTDLMGNQHGGDDLLLGDIRHATSRSATWTARWATEGTKTWSVTARSDNMTSVTDSVAILVDGTAPPLPTNLASTTHTLNQWSNNRTLTFTWTQPADNLSGVDGYGEFWSSANPPVPGNTRDFGAVTTRTITVASDYTNLYYAIRPVDRSGNWNAGQAVAGPYKIDTVDPSLVSNLVSSTHTPGVWSNVGTIVWTWTAATDDRSGVAGYSRNVSMGAPGLPDTIQDLGLVTTDSTTLASNASGRWFNIRTVDQAGNWTDTAANAGPFLIDVTAPSGPTNLFSSTHVPGTWAQVPTITVHWTSASDPHSGLAGYAALLDQTPGTVPAGALNLLPGATTTTQPVGSSPDGWWFHLRAKDLAGNWGAAQHLGPFLIDSLAPSGVSVVIDGGNAETTSLAVTLATAATDAQSGVDSMRFRNDGGVFSPWEPFAAARAWNLTDHGGSAVGGTRRVTVEVRDRATNATSAFDTIFFYVPVTLIGSACDGSLGPPTLAVSGIPGIGRTLTFTVGNTAAPTLVLYLGLSSTVWNGLALPLDLALYGVPGCFVNSSWEVPLWIGPVVPVLVGVPDEPALAGVVTWWQGVLVGDPGGRLAVTTRSARVEVAGS